MSGSESDDYDVPLSELAGGKPTSKPAAAAASDDSEDEDVPLGSLAKTPKTTPKPSKTKDAAKSPSSKTPSSKTPSSKGTKRSRDAASTSSKASSTSKAPRLGSVLSEGGVRILDKSLPLKEQAVEAILVRWQHVPDLQSAWPPVKAAEYPVPDSFRPLKGFLGVFVGVDDAENLGEVLDMRPVKPCPSKAYLMTLPCATLALYWKTALEGQLAELVQADGEGAASSALGRALAKEVSSAEKFARLAPRADREAEPKVAQFKAMLKGEKARRKAAALRLLNLAPAPAADAAGPAAPDSKA